MTDINVIKRNGTAEPLNLEKIHKVLTWACEGLEAYPSQIEMKSHLQFMDGIKSEDIHSILVKAAADLISEKFPDYQFAAARLLMFNLRKKAFGGFIPPHLGTHIELMTKLGKYDSHILEDYSLHEINLLDGILKHSRDLDFAYAGAKQLEGKYLVQDKVTKEIYESPQFLYMLVGMCLFSKESKDVRLKYVEDFYEAASTHKFSLPTPIMAGVRTTQKQFSSCTLIECGDSLESINKTTGAIVKYISQKAGIGLNVGSLRAMGSPIRGGQAITTGLLPFLKLFQAAVKSCSQGSVRSGAATAFYPIWHYEVEELLVLKNNKGVEENRVRHLDYGVQFNKLMYKRLLEGGNITLFSPHDVEGLYDAFFADQVEFERLYVEAEGNPSIRKKTVKAVELFSQFAIERAATGRIYLQNVDHCNEHTPFNPEYAPIKQSNLCVAPETRILTDKGYKVIEALEGQDVTVWNGEEWSDTKVVKTSDSSELVTVKTLHGAELDCTPYHKFYKVTNYYGGYEEVRAKDLVKGDKLIKFKLPVLDNLVVRPFKLAYQNGFFCGDGCELKAKDKRRIYLYHEKRALREKLGDIFCNEYNQPDQKRWYGDSKELFEKFLVPSSEYAVKDRLGWLAGLLDSDGTVARNGETQSLQIKSVNKEFLQRVQLMLQELGTSSKVSKTDGGGMKHLPKNDGSGENAMYNCQPMYRLVIGNWGVAHLQELGLVTYRLRLTKHKANRECSHFFVVDEVVNNGRTDKTYCVNEPKRNKVMFNGILTGNCLEIALPTKPMGDTEEEIALCTLAAFNLGELTSLSDLEPLARILVRALDNLLDYQNYPLKSAEVAAKARRSLGVGVINYAYYLAKNGVKYSDGSAKELTQYTFEAMQYYLLKASNSLAKEKGQCNWYEDTNYYCSEIPCLDTYKKEGSLNGEYFGVSEEKWARLERDISGWGLRNSTLSALMPSETSSQVSNATNGIEPPRSFVSIKTSKEGSFKQVVPDYKTLKDAYELLWDIPDNSGYIDLIGIMQRYVDQSISANTNYDPLKFPDGKVPVQVILKDILTAYKKGVKTLYYHNTRDGAGEETGESIDDGCEGGACKI